MKRPEGFDAAAEPPPPAPKRSRTKQRPVAAKKEAQRLPAQRRPAPEYTRPQKGDPTRAAKERRKVERLEVRRFTKRARGQRTVWLTVIGLALGLGGMLAVAIFSPLLAFTKLEVTGAVSVDEAAVRELVEAQLGTPLALIDHGAIRDGLERFPLIRSYVTEVTPPGTLTVHLIERAPVGVLRADAGFVVVDPAGVVLSRPADRPANLPLINLDAEGASGVGFAAVVEVLLALPPVLRADVDTADATTRDDVRLALRSGGQSVVWGSADRSELKARVLEKLLVARPAGSRIEYDVSAPLSPVVRSTD